MTPEEQRIAIAEKPKAYRKENESLRADLAKEKQRILFDQDAADKLSRCGAEVEVLKIELAKQIGSELSELSDLKARCEKLEGAIKKLIDPNDEFRGCPTCAHGTINRHSWPDCPYLVAAKLLKEES